jgi:hypothetical protein
MNLIKTCLISTLLIQNYFLQFWTAFSISHSIEEDWRILDTATRYLAAIVRISYDCETVTVRTCRAVTVTVLSKHSDWMRSDRALYDWLTHAWVRSWKELFIHLVDSQTWSCYSVQSYEPPLLHQPSRKIKWLFESLFIGGVACPASFSSTICWKLINK